MEFYEEEEEEDLVAPIIEKSSEEVPEDVVMNLFLATREGYEPLEKTRKQYKKQVERFEKDEPSSPVRPRRKYPSKIEEPKEVDIVFPIPIVYTGVVKGSILPIINESFSNEDDRKLAKCLMTRWIYMIPRAGSKTGVERFETGARKESYSGVFLWDPYYLYTAELANVNDPNRFDKFLEQLNWATENTPDNVIIYGSSSALGKLLYREHQNFEPNFVFNVFQISPFGRPDWKKDLKVLLNPPKNVKIQQDPRFTEGVGKIEKFKKRLVQFGFKSNLFEDIESLKGTHYTKADIAKWNKVLPKAIERLKRENYKETKDTILRLENDFFKYRKPLRCEVDATIRDERQTKDVRKIFGLKDIDFEDIEFEELPMEKKDVPPEILEDVEFEEVPMEKKDVRPKTKKPASIAQTIFQYNEEEESKDQSQKKRERDEDEEGLLYDEESFKKQVISGKDDLDIFDKGFLEGDIIEDEVIIEDILPDDINYYLEKLREFLGSQGKEDLYDTYALVIKMWPKLKNWKEDAPENFRALQKEIEQEQ